ncbi:glycosyltransferase family protein [Pedobacter lusitanus]|uniref:hypothetical protein n=1 Tax=Pedobacter lusitanus TaxID=1503925 RepID=UPI000698C0C5|nr:hypothetical protein [Pedobacter lusitanus]
MKQNMGMAPKNLLCFSHLRWDFLLQRPQQLLLRFANDTNVFFVENPVFDAKEGPYLSFGTRSETLWKLVPHLRPGLSSGQITKCMTRLIDEFLVNADLDNWTFWYYTSSALAFTKKHKPKLTIFDCMDEVSMFRRSPEEMTILEKKLVEKADLVFTQGYSQHDNRKTFHANVHSFPCVDPYTDTVRTLSWDDTYTAMFRLIRHAATGKSNHRKLLHTISYSDQSTMLSKGN